MADASPIGEFAQHQSGLTAPARKGFAITPHNTNPLAVTPRAIYVGGAGNIVITGLDGADFTLVAVPAGSIIPVMPLAVKATGTTATNLVGLL